MLAPDDDGVGGRPQQNQVPGQPAPAGDRVAKGQAMIWTAAAWQLSNRLTR